MTSRGKIQPFVSSDLSELICYMLLAFGLWEITIDALQFSEWVLEFWVTIDALECSQWMLEFWIRQLSHCISVFQVILAYSCISVLLVHLRRVYLQLTTLSIYRFIMYSTELLYSTTVLMLGLTGGLHYSKQHAVWITNLWNLSWQVGMYCRSKPLEQLAQAKVSEAPPAFMYSKF